MFVEVTHHRYRPRMARARLKLVCVENKPAKSCLRPASKMSCAQQLLKRHQPHHTVGQLEKEEKFQNSCVSCKVVHHASSALLKVNVYTLLLMQPWSRLSLILLHNAPLCGAAGLSTLLCDPDKHHAAALWTWPAVPWTQSGLP